MEYDIYKVPPPGPPPKKKCGSYTIADDDTLALKSAYSRKQGNLSFRLIKTSKSLPSFQKLPLTAITWWLGWFTITFREISEHFSQSTSQKREHIL
jgi:hypothetical protein